jgi:hypothetical protein
MGTGIWSARERDCYGARQPAAFPVTEPFFSCLLVLRLGGEWWRVIGRMAALPGPLLARRQEPRTAVTTARPRLRLASLCKPVHAWLDSQGGPRAQPHQGDRQVACLSMTA